jgi:hypothetical protein
MRRPQFPRSANVGSLVAENGPSETVRKDSVSLESKHCKPTKGAMKTHCLGLVLSSSVLMLTSEAAEEVVT